MDPSVDLPFQSKPHDAMRNGLASLKEDVISVHPVEVIQRTTGPGGAPGVTTTKVQMLRDLYGIALPAKMEIERQILNKFERLPGLHSSKLGLESLTGALDTFGFESYLGLPEDSELPPSDIHSQMEKRLGMDSTKPVARGII
jgi:proteasome maturation protein